MGRADYFAPGDYNAVCSLCGFKRKASQLVRNWQGLYRCPEHNEPRHPQDFVRAVADNQTVPWSQPPGEAEALQTLGISSSIGSVAITANTSYDTVVHIEAGVTIGSITLTGPGKVVINNYGIVSAFTNNGATVELRNRGKWPA